MIEFVEKCLTRISLKVLKIFQYSLKKIQLLKNHLSKFKKFGVLNKTQQPKSTSNSIEPALQFVTKHYQQLLVYCELIDGSDA